MLLGIRERDLLDDEGEDLGNGEEIEDHRRKTPWVSGFVVYSTRPFQNSNPSKAGAK